MNAGANDYRLQAGSPAINNATLTGAPATDIVQNLRSCNPDMGEYEFGSNNVGLYDNVWTGCTSNNWNTASNWSLNQVPTTNQNVYIPGTNVIVTQPQISSANQKCFTISLDVINGANLLISPGGDLEISKP